MTDRATKKQIRYILALNQELGGGPARYANQLAVELPIRLRSVDLHTATRRQGSEIIQRLLAAREQGSGTGQMAADWRLSHSPRRT